MDYDSKHQASVRPVYPAATLRQQASGISQTSLSRSQTTTASIRPQMGPLRQQASGLRWVHYDSKHQASDGSEAAGFYCDSLQQPWDNIPQTRGINYLVVLGEAKRYGQSDADRAELTTWAIGFIHDPYQLVDPSQPPSTCMPALMVALAQMVIGPNGDRPKW
ncbi:MAG: hypothetical protein ALECFALPRED_006166 [Alectoria fallacina]|uniref:Uncharacterized protein n=1 Tax=Alectoria fallacina TaxID=1903189 RepID=A0A8H3G4X2_9LECA|nr:MAG: hypothetical protein ALECFALPRED_006166 [Alectoria fallacina]